MPDGGAFLRREGLLLLPLEQVEKAFALSTACFNLALMPADSREKVLREMRQSLQMGDAEFAEFERSLIIPMVQRHREMFPLMHADASAGPWLEDLGPPPPPTAVPERPKAGLRGDTNPRPWAAAMESSSGSARSASLSFSRNPCRSSLSRSTCSARLSWVMS